MLPADFSVGGFEVLQSCTDIESGLSGLILHDHSFPSNSAIHIQILDHSTNHWSPPKKSAGLLLATETSVEIFQYLLTFLSCKLIMPICSRKMQALGFIDCYPSEEPAAGGAGDDADAGDHNHGGHGPRYAH